MAVATLCGVYPTSLFLTYVIGQYIQGLHPAFRTLIVAGCMVGLLTWVVMPQVTKVLKPWLSGQSPVKSKTDRKAHMHLSATKGTKQKVTTSNPLAIYRGWAPPALAAP